MKSTKLLLTIIALTLSTLFVFGQTKTIKGRLVSIEDRTPIPGYNVVEPGTTNGAITDINGEFTLKINSIPGVILFPGCFNGLYVEYGEGVDFREVVLGTDNEKGPDWADSKKAEWKYLRSRPTRLVYGSVIDKKTKEAVYNCEVRLK